MAGGSVPPARVAAAIDALEAYCRERDWAGFDPYDALNSEWFGRTPLSRSRVARIALTQLLKRSPIDFRPLLRVRPRHDPKATALFLRFYVKRAVGGDAASRAVAARLADRLLSLRSPALERWCWGYSFPWQTRRELVPRSSPNLVTTVFAAQALLDAWEAGLGEPCLQAAADAGRYLASDLFWSDGERAAFAYPRPDNRVPVHNANLLGAALLCRLARVTGERGGVGAALRVARYSAGGQAADGSWAYGLGATQQWVDGFHTGYNLCALRSIARDLATGEFDDVIRRGFAFYRTHFFTPEGVARYFHDRTYPIDIHCVAQGLITLTAFRDLDPEGPVLAGRVLAWAMGRMWDPRGFFYYRVLRGVTNRIPYMRWSLAWMLVALGEVDGGDAGGSRDGRVPAPVALRPSVH